MPETCEHQWGGNHHSDTGYSCSLCGATGHYDPDKGEIVVDARAAPAEPETTA